MKTARFERRILILCFGTLAILISGVVYIDSRGRENEFNRKLSYFSDEGYTLNETDYWRQKANLMNWVTYIRVDIETLKTMASQRKNEKGDCYVSYDSKEGYIWIFDIIVGNTDNHVYYWEQAFYQTK